MIRSLFLAAALFAAPAPALAQTAVQPAAQPGTIQTARAIVAQMQMEKMLDPMFAQLMPLMVSNVENAMRANAAAPAPLKARLETETGRQQVGAIITEEFSNAFRARYADIREATAEEYRKTFTEAELAAILAFYRSPAGTKLVQAQPQLQQVLSQAGRAVGQDAAIAAFPKIQARITALDAAPAK